MKHCVALTLLSALLLSAPSAWALTEDQKQTLRSLDYFKSEVDLKTRPFRDGQSDDDVSSALYSYESTLKTVQERLGKIPPGDRKDPMYEGYAAWARDFESTMKRWQAERAANAQKLKTAGAAEEAYKSETRENSAGLEFVKQLRGTYPYALNDTEMLTKWRAAEKLAAYAAKCDKEFADVDTKSYGGRDKAENCKTAGEWRAVVTPFLEKRALENTARIGTQLESLAGRIAKGESTYDDAIKRLRAPDEYIATIRPGYEALFQAMGRPVPNGLFAPISNGSKGYAAAVAASQAKVSYQPGKFVDGNVTAAVKAALAARNVKVLKVSQTMADWSIRKNDYGIPTHRIRDSVVLAQVPGESFCRVIGVTAKQDYAGGGRGGPTSGSSVPVRVRYTDAKWLEIADVPPRGESRYAIRILRAP